VAVACKCVCVLCVCFTTGLWPPFVNDDERGHARERAATAATTKGVSFEPLAAISRPSIWPAGTCRPPSNQCSPPAPAIRQHQVSASVSGRPVAACECVCRATCGDAQREPISLVAGQRELASDRLSAHHHHHHHQRRRCLATESFSFVDLVAPLLSLSWRPTRWTTTSALGAPQGCRRARQNTMTPTRSRVLRAPMVVAAAASLVEANTDTDAPPLTTRHRRGTGPSPTLRSSQSRSNEKMCGKSKGFPLHGAWPAYANELVKTIHLAAAAASQRQAAGLFLLDVCRRPTKGAAKSASQRRSRPFVHTNDTPAQAFGRVRLTPTTRRQVSNPISRLIDWPRRAARPARLKCLSGCQ
jgi:hypothetical protein